MKNERVEETPPEPISVPTECTEPKRPDGGGNRLTPSVSEELSESLVGD